MSESENQVKPKRERKPKQPKERVQKESDERYTPEYVLDIVRVVGPISLDPCTTVDNRTNATRFFTFADDGLTQDWLEVSQGGIIFVNPPFSKLRAWTKKCAEEGARGCNIIALLPGDTSTIWFQDVVGPSAAAVCFYRGRIEFIRTSKAFGAGAMQPTMFAFWGSKAKEFQNAFSPHGFVVTRSGDSLKL